MIVFDLNYFLLLYLYLFIIFTSIINVYMFNFNSNLISLLLLNNKLQFTSIGLDLPLFFGIKKM